MCEYVKLTEINQLLVEFMYLDDVAKDNVLAAGNSDRQLTNAVCHIIHVTLQAHKHADHIINHNMETPGAVCDHNGTAYLAPVRK